MSEIINKLSGINKPHSQTVREKLAQTYFDNSEQTVKTLTSSPNQRSTYKRSKKNLYAKKNLFPFMVLILISLFMFLILLRYGERDNFLIDTALGPLAKPISESISQPTGTDLLLIDDFDQIAATNKLGGYFGTFSQTPDDLNQFCRFSFDKDRKIGFSGYSLRLDYSLESPNSVNNGFWMSLSNLDAANYSGLEFFIKGAEDRGYPASLEIQLKNADQSGVYRLNDIDGAWHRIYVPFEKFEGLKDLDHLLKMLIVFEVNQTEPKTGTVYLDN